MAFCEHLDEYGVQYVKTEAAYQQCNHLVARIQEDGGDSGLVELLEEALLEWKRENTQLRADFSLLVKEGHVRLPKMKKMRPRCSQCDFVVPKLEYKEWAIAYNGVAALNGEELMVPQTSAT